MSCNIVRKSCVIDVYLPCFDLFGTSKSCNKNKKNYYNVPTKNLQKIKYIFALYVKTQCQPCQGRADMVKAQICNRGTPNLSSQRQIPGV
jgi:hypothetical protein